MKPSPRLSPANAVASTSGIDTVTTRESHVESTATRVSATAVLPVNSHPSRRTASQANGTLSTTSATPSGTGLT